MKKAKQILAWIGIVILVGVYAVTFILGVTGNAATKDMFMAAIACTVIIPTLMYGMILLAKVLGKKEETPDLKDQSGTDHKQKE
ncbi:MAG: hypothetical protein PHE06_14815 [Lachnospiraceae bacterium]|nr:hypothetical protein [Lachnospiraceae bacterium]